MRRAHIFHFNVTERRRAADDGAPNKLKLTSIQENCYFQTSAQKGQIGANGTHGDDN